MILPTETLSHPSPIDLLQTRTSSFYTPTISYVYQRTRCVPGTACSGRSRSKILQTQDSLCSIWGLVWYKKGGKYSNNRCILIVYLSFLLFSWHLGTGRNSRKISGLWWKFGREGWIRFSNSLADDPFYFNRLLKSKTGEIDSLWICLIL